MAGKTLMVIGGSGFFGKSFLDARRRDLLAAWNIERIVVVARHADALRRTHPALLDQGVTLLNADIGTASDLPAADFVIHAASSTDARRYAEYPQEERANILRSVDTYCTIAQRVHRDAGIVYTSSGAVYGQQPPGVARIEETFEPGQIAGLASYKHDYAEAKRLAEQRIAALGQRGLRVTVARCFAFVGLYLPRDQHFAIGNFIEDGRQGRPIAVHATKPVYRSYMHADDLVRWLMTMAANASPACPIYNVGSEEGMTMGEIAATVAERFGVPTRIPALTDPAVDRYVPSVAKARDALGLDLTFDLAAAVEDIKARLQEAHG